MNVSHEIFINKICDIENVFFACLFGLNGTENSGKCQLIFVLQYDAHTVDAVRILHIKYLLVDCM